MDTLQENQPSLDRDHLNVKASLDNLREVLAFVDARLEEVFCPIGTQMQLDIAVEELFVNIANYAYKLKNGDAKISLWFENSPKTVVIEFRDSGIPYNPLEKEDPDITLSADQRQIGGLGIFMVKKSMDDMQYRWEDGQNVLTIRKKL